MAQQPFDFHACWLRTGKHITHDIGRKEGQIDQLLDSVL